MKKTLMTASLLSLLVCTASASGLNLGWSDCPTGAGYKLDNNFACNTNTGAANILVGSYFPPAGLTAVNSNEAVVDVQTDQSALSPWWTMGSTGCVGRTGTPTGNFDFTGGPSSCTDYWAGNASGGASYYPAWSSDPPHTGGPANRARIILVCAISEGLAGALDPGTEYYSFKCTISNARTVGTPSCAGCTDLACLVMNSIKIIQNPGLGDVYVEDVAQARHVTWRGGLSPDCQATPAKQSTWGSVKALYR